MLEESLARLNATFELVRFRDALKPFRRVVAKYYEQLASYLHDRPELLELDGNFKTSESQALLGRLRGCLDGLDVWDLKIVGALETADRLIHFYRKHTGPVFAAALERAQDNAASEPHTAQVLRKLDHIRTLLEPFWNIVAGGHTARRLADIQQHFARHRRMRPAAPGQEAMCISLEELSVVIANWADTELYFLDEGNTEDIVKAVKTYQQTGRYISSLQAQDGGASLSFSFGTSELKTLDNWKLQEKVHMALLGADSDLSTEARSLSQFELSYRMAQQAHELRLKVCILVFRRGILLCALQLTSIAHLKRFLPCITKRHSHLCSCLHTTIHNSVHSCL